jgi:hypothetical protein
MRLAAAIILLAAATSAAAQAPADLMSCVGIASDSDRLACYDRIMANASPAASAAATLRAAETTRLNTAVAAAAAVAAQQRAEADAGAKRAGFGAENVTSRADRFAPPPGQLQEVETGISDIMANNSGLGVFLLENGQLWKQVDTASTPNARIGDRVLLTRAPLGGYKLNFVKQKRWVLVKRVR